MSFSQAYNNRLTLERRTWTAMRDAYDEALSVIPAHSSPTPDPHEHLIRHLLSMKLFYSVCLSDDHEQVITMANNVKNIAGDYLDEAEENSNNEDVPLGEGYYLQTANEIQKRVDDVNNAVAIHYSFQELRPPAEDDDYESEEDDYGEAELNDPESYFNIQTARESAWRETLSPEELQFYRDNNPLGDWF